MRKIDFLSEYPRAYIFEKDINKTNFGGVLFLIYSIIMLIISISYILDFTLNDKFEVEYLSINNQTLSRDLEVLDKDPDLNPTLEFKFLVPNESMYKNFRIVLIKNGQPNIEKFQAYYKYDKGIKIGLSLNSTVSNFEAYLVFFCGTDPDCLINEQKYSIQNDTRVTFEFETGIPKISHQDSKKPILEEDKIYHTLGYISDFKSFYNDILFWKVIKYIEKKGISR